MSTTNDYNVAILGTPSRPRGAGGEPIFTAQAVERVKALGFTAIQLNIAWGARPADEPLNLEDILPADGASDMDRERRWREEIRRRASLCRAAGLRAIFHFGAPRVDGTLYKTIVRPDFVEGQNVSPCILHPATVHRYVDLLGRLARECPEVDDIVVYTFDQEAWICGEFGSCPRCRGIPLHERLPQFLLPLARQWQASRPEGRVFWEPWELSAGQVYRTIESLAGRTTPNFGLMLHGNIAEVMLTHTADPWFRNAARLAAEAGLPVVAETFLSGSTEEVEPLQHVAVPRLAYEAATRLRAVHGVVGIKEYYGIAPDASDPNLEIAGLTLREPGIELEEALARVAIPYGEAAAEVRRGWESAAKGFSSFPWDLCWKFRHNANRPPVHSWDAFWFDGHLCDSPSWCSTRRTVFMLTETEGPLHSWLLEDIGLRWEQAAEHMARAISAYEAAAPLAPPSRREDLALWAADLRVLSAIAEDFARHARETVLARMIRRAIRDGLSDLTHLIAQLEHLLAADVTAHSPHVDAAARVRLANELAAFQVDPRAWAGDPFPGEAEGCSVTIAAVADWPSGRLRWRETASGTDCIRDPCIGAGQQHFR